MKILIDNGHGITTPGKRSPDGRFREYRYTREIAGEVVSRLKKEGYDAELLVPEDGDISLSQRCIRANAWCDKLGYRKVCLVSIHNNAAGNGTAWMTGTGWEVWTSKGQTQGDKLADCLYDAALRILVPLFPGMKMRADYSDGDPDKEENFTILQRTKCAACLTENFFQDNQKDVQFLESAVGRDAVIKLHVEGIKTYIKEYAQH